MLERQDLIHGLKIFDLSPEAIEQVVEKLNRFSMLVVKWNKTHNLTTITKPQEFLSKHILDSLSVHQFLLDKNISEKRPLDTGLLETGLLDIGSGAGFPGFPLAIVNPDLDVVSIDASQKRIAFQRQAIRELKLENISAHHGRVEDFQSQKFSAITCRAVASITSIVESSQHLLSKGGTWYLMKGARPDSELEALAQGDLSERFKVTAVVPVKIPRLEADRHIVCVERR